MSVSIPRNPWNMLLPEPKPIEVGTKLEIIDPEQLGTGEDFGEVVEIDGKLAKVHWKRADIHEYIERDELHSVETESWTEKYWKQPGRGTIDGWDG